MSDIRTELQDLKVGDSMIYSDAPQCGVFRVTRKDDPYPIRDVDSRYSKVYDFVNGYTEDPSVKNMNQLYERLFTEYMKGNAPVGVISASGRDMTGDVLLYLGARSRLSYLLAQKQRPPDYAVDSQRKIIANYRKRLGNYGDACIVVTRSELDRELLLLYGNLRDMMRGILERAKAAAKGEAYVVEYFDRRGFDRQVLQGKKISEMEPTARMNFFGKFEVSKYFENRTFMPRYHSVIRAQQDQQKPEQIAAVQERMPEPKKEVER